MGAASCEQEGLLWIFRWITQRQCEDWWSHWLNSLLNLTWHFLVDLVAGSVSIFFSLFPVVPTFFFFLFFFCFTLYVTLMIWYLFPWYYFYCAHLCMKCSLGISNFLKEISNLSHSIVFLYFFAMITEESFLISPCCSLQLRIQMDISFHFSFTFGFSFFSYICKASSDNNFAFFHFFWGLFWSLLPVQCHKPPSIVLQALYQN